MVITATSIADAANIRTTNDIFDLEDAYVAYVESQPQDDRQGVWHPSALGMCGRMNVYEYIRAPKQQMHTEQDLEVFRLGHSIHGIVQGTISDLERVLSPRGISMRFEAEKSYDPKADRLFTDFGIGGTTDGVLELWTTLWKQRGILEVKSMKSDYWKELNGPKDDHLEQAHIYAFRFDCPIMWFWYYNKDTSERQVFRRVFDPNVLNRALARIESWRQHVVAGTLPEREESYWACPRCPYSNLCQPSVLNRIKGRNNAQQISAVRKKGFGT